MRRLRHIAVWSLLAVFVVGGVVGPSLHRVKHATEKITSTAERPCDSSEAHATDVPLWTHHCASLEGLDCDLCATRLVVVPPSLGPDVVPGSGVSVWTGILSHLTSAAVVADPFIRGPPSRA